MVLDGIDYKRVFHFFEEISGIPRGSRDNEAISNYLVEFAKERNLRYVQDDKWNVILFKGGSEGANHLPPVILQGHMDMVCVKEPGVEHDFEREGINLEIEDGFIRGKGTSLGGDDGIAIAYALAILDGKDFVHPPLEVVVTSDEEVGLLGATYMDVSPLKGACFINIDGEEEGYLLASCAGGVTAECRYPLQREEAEGEALEISISGLQGGHSGMDIDKKRTNAIGLLGRLLLELEGDGYSLEKASGGGKDNVIPSEATCRLLVTDGDADDLVERVEKFAASIKKELLASEPSLAIHCGRLGACKGQALTKDGLRKLVKHIALSPDGVQVMSAHVEGLVESSLNLGIMEVGGEELCFTHAIRSSVGSYKEYLCKKMKRLTSSLGGTYQEQGDYPEWEFKDDSAFRDMACQVYERRFGQPIKVEAIHAGLECGVFDKKLKDVEMISIGPDVHDVHSPKERLDVESAKRMFDYVAWILEEYVKRA